MEERCCVTYLSLHNFVHYMSSKKYSSTQFWHQSKQHLIYNINYFVVKLIN